MSTYRIYFTQVASASAEVQADSHDEAIDLAWDALPPDVCAQCSGWGRDYSLELGGEWQLDETEHEVDGTSVRADG